MKKVISMLLICVCLLTVCAVGLVPANAANVVAEASAQKNMDDFIKFLKSEGVYTQNEYYVFKDKDYYENKTTVTPYYYYYNDGHILLYNKVEYPKTHVKVSITLPAKYNGKALFTVDYEDDAGETFTMSATVVAANYNGTNAVFKKDKGNTNESLETLNASANRMAKLAFVNDDNTVYAQHRNETGITGFGFPGMCRKHVYFPTVAPATFVANGAVKGTCHWCGNCITQKNIAKIALVSPSKTAFYYNGKAQAPVITVKDAKGNTLKYGTDYTLVYSSTNRKAIGKYAVKVKFKGNYAGSALLYYTINPAKPGISSIAAGKVAAINIDSYLGYSHKLDFGVKASTPHFIDRKPCGRCNIKEREAAIRKQDFQAVGLGLSNTEAKQEALRCLRCDKFGLGALKQGGHLPW